MLIYVQSTGSLYRGGRFLSAGYSGHGKGLNNHAMQNIPRMGPIPCGDWRILGARDSATTGPVTIDLAPGPETETFGRSAFRFHGDNNRNDRSASAGCIVIPRQIRELIVTSGETALAVLP